MAKFTSVVLPHDLPENWTDNQYVSPGGLEVGLTEQHGFNYLMKMVNACQQAILDIDAYLSSGVVSRNLLHNWWLGSPIDVKEGYIIPTGSSYYGSEALASKVGSTPYALVPNYIGSNYATYILSGNTFYVSKASLTRGYIGSVDGSMCIDRWRVKSQSTLVHSTVEPQSGACKVTLAKQSGDFYQDVTRALMGTGFRGLTYTFSLKVESVSDGTMNMYITDGSSTKQFRIQSPGVYSVSLQAAAGASKLVVGIKNTNATNAGIIKLVSAKLEVGSVSTLDIEPPVDKAEQMAICTQFDPTTDEYRGFSHLATVNTVAEASVTE